jgi:tetratricopeptide (TPR) repeat protein
MSSRNWLFGLILIVATTLAYQPAWNGKPVWDDNSHITSIELRSLHGLGRIWTNPAAAPQYYPLLHTVFWLEYKLWKDWPLPYHLITIFFHLLSALLFLKVLQRLKVPGAWLAAAIFALHPVHVESVAWFSEIKNTLSTALCVGAALIYLDYDESRKRSAYFLAFVLFVLALLTKTAVVALPPVLLVLFWWKRGKLSWERDLKPLVPFFIAAAAGGIVTVWVEQKFCTELGETFAFSVIDRCLIAGRLFWFYLGKLFWPSNLILIYPAWNISSHVWWQYLFPLAAFGLFIGLWMARRWSRAPFAAALCFLLMLFPVLGFFNLSFFMSAVTASGHDAIFRADHFQYLASLPIIGLVAAGLTVGVKRAPEPYRLAGYASGVLLLLALAFLTRAQSGIYRDNETCFRAILSKNPNSPTAHNNLGIIDVEKGLEDEAIAHFERAFELQPNYPLAHYNLANALLQKRQLEQAIPHLQIVLNANPNHSKAYYVLGNALFGTGKTDRAILAYERALKLDPDFPDAHCNLGNAFLEKGEIDKALAHYRTGLALQPNNPGAHYNLAVGLVRKGELEPAIAELRIALRIDPAYPDAEPLLGDLLARKTQP